MQALFQFSNKFCLSLHNQTATVNLIKNIEYNFQRIKLPKISELRNKIFPLIKNITLNKTQGKKKIYSSTKNQ